MNNPSPYSFFKAYSDPSRLRILHILTQGERCVCDIMAVLKMGQSKVSRHLAYLKRIGLVKGRREGLWIHYSLIQPKSDFQEKLLDCLGSCLDESTVFSRDIHLLKKITENKKLISKKGDCR